MPSPERSGTRRPRDTSDTSDTSGDEGPPKRRRMSETEIRMRERDAAAQASSSAADESQFTDRRPSSSAADEQHSEEEHWRASSAEKTEYRQQVVRDLQELSDKIINNIKISHQGFPQDAENEIRGSIRIFVENCREEHQIGIIREIESVLPRLQAHRFQVEHIGTRVDEIMYLGLGAHQRSQLPSSSGSSSEGE